MTTVARALDRARPVYLIEISLQNSGPALYLSDRNITVDGRLYEDYILSVETASEEALRTTSSGLNSPLKIGFKNERWRSYAYLIEAGETYPFEGARLLLKETCLDDSGTPASPETVFVGRLDAPQDIDLMGFSCGVSSMEYVAD